MNSGKKKSSGWRPPEKRRTPEPDPYHTAEKRGECDGLRLWRCCPADKCRRVRGCIGDDPQRCIARRTPEVPQAPSRTAAAIENQPRGFVLSAAEAAAAIKASLAEVSAPAPAPGEEWQMIVRDGRVHYEPRRRSE